MSRRRYISRCALPVFTALLVIGPAPAALAQRTIAPPGNSGVDQYMEVVPSARGNTAPGRGDGSALSPDAQRKLDRHGREGRQLAQIVNQTAPDRGTADSGSTSDRERTDKKRKTPNQPKTPNPLKVLRSTSPSATRALTAAAPRSDGMGITLPLLLGLSTLALVGLALRRRGG